MADSSYYAKKKAESDKKIQDALKAREARTTNAESSNAKSSDNKISAALEARSQRVQNSLPDVAADIQKALTVEIDFYNGTTPTYGAYEDTYKSQRERRINISNLRDRVKAYSGYMDSSVVDYIISTLDKMESGYDAYLGMSQFQSEDDFNEAVEQAKADAKRWSELTGGYDSSKHQAEGEAGWNDYVATQERIAKNKEQAEEETPWWEKLLGYLGDAGQDTSLPLHTTETARQGYRDWEAGMNKPDERWTEDQKFTYGYLWNTSRSKAAEYAYAVNNMLNTQQEQQQVQEIQGWATENFGAGAGNTAAAILSAPLGMADYLGDLISQGTLGYIPEADGQITPFEYSQAVTGGISQHLNETGGTLNENIPIIGGRGWGDVYGLGTSILQSAAAAYSGGSAQALITFFGSASASGVDDALSRGATGDQALMYGSAVGAAEALAEMIGVDNLLKIGSAATLRQLLWNILKQGGAEALEEGLTSFLGNIADNVIMGDKSHFYLNVAEYQKAGLSEEEAKKKAWGKMWGDMAYDMLGGFVSGSVHAGPQTAYQTIKSNGEMKANYGASQNELVSEALEINPDNAFAQKMQGRLDAGKNLSGSQLSRLVQQNEAALTAQDMSSIQSATEARLSELGETGDVAAIAAALTKQAAGEKLSRAEQQAIANSKYGQRVANELNTENISSGEYASAWAENIGTERINAEEYSRLVEAAQLPQETTGSAGSQVVSPTATNRGNRTVEQQPKSQYDVSDDGKMFLKSDPDKTINVTGVESVKDGKLILKTKDGTVASNEVVYATKADALIYEAVANMGATPASAWTMINSFKESDGVSAQDYATLLPLAYKYGKNNYRNGLLKLDLTPKQSSIAFQMGREDAAAAVKPTTQVSTKFTLSEKHADKKIIFEGFSYNEKSANDVQKASMAAIDTINKMSSLEIHVYKSVKKNGKLYAIVNGKERLAPNGYFTDGNKVYIDINAGNKGEGLMLYTLSHEIGHYIARYNAQDFKAISDFLFEHYGKDVPIDMLLENQKHKLRKSYETDGKAIPSESVLEKEAKEELVCDMLSRMLADKNAYDKLMALKQKDLNAFQKLGQAIKKALDKLAKIIGVYDTQNPDFMYAASVENFGEEAFRQLQDLYIKAFVQADANYQAEVGQKNTTQEGGDRFSFRDSATGMANDLLLPYNEELVRIIENNGGIIVDSFDKLQEVVNLSFDEPTRKATAYFGILDSSLLEQIEKKIPNIPKDLNGKVFKAGRTYSIAASLDSIRHLTDEKGLTREDVLDYLDRMADTIIDNDTVSFDYYKDGWGQKSKGLLFKKSYDDGTMVSFEIVSSKKMSMNMQTMYMDSASYQKKKSAKTLLVQNTPAHTPKARDSRTSNVNVAQTGNEVNNKSTEAIDLNVDEKTESVAPSVLMSERTWTESDYVQEREQAAKEIAKAIGVSVKKAKAYIDSVNSIAKMIAEDRVRLDYFSSPGRSSFVGNVEYGGSFDFSTLCKKRRLLTGTFTAIQKALPNTALTADEILDIRNRMKNAGLEVSCGLCYVEGSRANMGQFAKEFLRLYKQYYPDAWQPNMADVNTPDGIEWVRINHPECYEQYEYFWNHYGTLKDGDKNLFASQQKPKLYQLHTEYKGEILEKFNDDDNVEEKNLNGGIRLQSFSDFEIVHLIDTMQIIMDMSRVGLAGQAYTKVPDFAWALGDTGLKINLSLIAKGVDANGRLIFDDVEGMPIDKAVELRNRYSKNVGTILVAFNDEQLMAAMADERVDYIIPFHRSQWKKSQYGAMGLPAKTKDYTYMQNEKFIKPQYHEYRGRMVKDKATNYMPNEYWDFSKSGKENAEAYLEMCARNNKRPKFYKLLQNNGDGSYSLKADGSTDGYWKLLIDFKMYDNDGVGSPQMPVKPDFNMDEATRMLDEYSGGHSNFPVAQSVVDSFVEEYKDRHKGVQFSDRDSDYLDAVKRGDMETAQKMVDEAAKAAGYTTKGYHGSPSDFTVVDGYLWLSRDELVARYYYGRGKTSEPTRNAPRDIHGVYPVRYRLGQNLLIDADSHSWAELPVTENEYAGVYVDEDTGEISTNAMVDWAAEHGYDSVTFVNVYDGGESATTVDVVLNPHRNAKSADPVTYDDSGNVIPLSERFNQANDDIRYSDRDTAALEAFGTTTNFEQAGFVLGDGRMLNLSQYGLNGVKHQRIEQVYDDVKGSEAINRFIQEGHVRIKASSPGIEIGSEVAPTVSQMNTISRFINTSLVKKGYFYLDITGKNGETIASVEYDEDASTEDIIWDIKDYYDRGKVPKERRTLFQDRDYVAYDRTAILKEETVDRWLKDYASKASPNYAQMYITYIDPNKFLKLTTSITGRHYIEKESKSLDEAEFADYTKDQPIFLEINHDTGEVTGHEGRHRCVALLDAGINSVPVLLQDYSNKYDKQVIDSIKLTGQVFKDSRSLDSFNVKDIIPLNYANRDEIIKRFATQSSMQRVGERLGLRQTLKFQDRGTDSVSNRSLLANAFEGVAQNEIEKNKIREYKGKIDLINAEEQKLSELNEKIKELSFAKGPRDTKAIRDLQFEARQTANRISTYDKQLLRLEASKPLQDVLQREKKMAYKRAEQKGKEALAAYKERAAKTQRDLLDKWQDSRKKGIDSRNRTAMRHKIKDVVNELNQYLLRGTKERHVPIELQKAVAEALDAVNMDTVGAEERIAKLRDELLKAKTPEQIQEISRKIDHIQAMGDKMNGRLQKLKEAYDQFVNSDDPLIANSHDEVISNKLQSVIDSIGNTPLRDMTLNQLEDVYDMYKMVLTTIRNANKAFKAKKNESISTIANQVMVEVEKVGGKQKQSLAILNGIKSFGWNNLKPVYAFEHIGSEHFTEVFNNVRAGEDVWAVDVTEAREFYLDKSKKHNYDSWDLMKRYNFTSTSGMDFELDLEQIMSLYAYSKRDQAADHLKKGGIVFDESTKIIKKTKAGISLEFNPTEATAYNISEETLADIVSKLTGEQKAFVDEMQDYLSTVMGAKGNEVSLEMYGVKLFKEKFYFPLKSAQQFMAKAKEQQQGEAKIKNSGFSKETVQKASNPIVLTPFMNVWADHVNEMSMYHAFVLPMEDFYRVYNYKTPTSDTMATESVEMFIQNAYGKGATKYIDQLLKDLNGGARSDTTTGVINKMIGLFKKGAVFASLSVVIQQPSAIARAAALVDTKYFIGPKVDHKRHKALWDEVKQYAPVAIIKEMGYFDTHMGKSTQDFIIGKEYSGFKDKMSALVKDSDYRDEVLSKAPALADEIAWCGIWEAVKRELKAKNPGMDVKSEAFLKMAGDRFTEVIVKTQVYDSVLSRSGMMRSKDTGMKMATSFMAEPTTSINMVADALLQGKRGNRKYARAAIGAVIASQILNSILVSFVYAGRDDDEEESYWEKYIGTLSGEVLDSLNPLTYIPFIKDIVSIVQGYDVERSDMSVISDLWKAWENLGKDNVSAYRKVEGFAGSIAQIFGLPVKNIMRDARGIYQTVMSFVDGEHTTAAGIGHAIKGSITGKDVPNGQQLYEAYLSGDAAQIARVKSRFDDQNAINNAVRKALRENDPRIKEAAIAWNANDLDEYMRIAKEIIAEKHFVQDDVVMAIRSEANALAPDAESETQSKAKGLFTAEKFAAAIAQGDQAMANAIKTDILQSAVKNGKTAEEAVKSFNSSAKTELKELYLTGDITEQEAINALTTYCGSDEGSAKADVQYWAFKQDYPDIHADDQWFDTYYEKIADSGIDIDVYMEYRNTVSTITGEGKKEKRMAVINSLPITSAQKDALYFAEGWTSSKLYEAPWH